MARERIQKVIAAAGIASRRGGEDLIRAGRVTVDGRPAIIGEQVDPEMQRVMVDGKPLPAIDGQRSYWLLNKPAGVVSTVQGPPRRSRRSWSCCRPNARREARLYPVGRLDEESEGLLLFTNDGAWADLLLHPRYGVEREYMVGLDRSVTKQQKLAPAQRHRARGGHGPAGHARGRHAGPGPEPAGAAGAAASPTCAGIGSCWPRAGSARSGACSRPSEMPVRRLVRVRVGTLSWRDLQAGEARPLTHHEVAHAGLVRPPGHDHAVRARVKTPAGSAAADGWRPPDRLAAARPSDAAPSSAGAAPAVSCGRDDDPNPPSQPTRLVVALDGPSSSGKSTVGAEAARRLGYRFCDTGLLYRAVTWLALERGIAPDQSRRAGAARRTRSQLVADARGRLRHVEAAGRDVTGEVRGADVDRAVSDYSKVPELRAALVPRQRALAADGGIIMAGRDIGTVILPDADVKIYLYASPEERARRRAAQRRIGADDAEAGRSSTDMRRRDAIDSGRETAPSARRPTTRWSSTPTATRFERDGPAAVRPGASATRKWPLEGRSWPLGSCRSSRGSPAPCCASRPPA